MKTFILIMITTMIANSKTLDEVGNDCWKQVKYGYLRQISFKGKDRINVWGKKDLYGKFDSIEICESDRKKYKKGWSEECEPIFIGKPAKFTIYFSRVKPYNEYIDYIYFDSKELCESAVKNGGEFRGENSPKKYQLRPMSKKDNYSFTQECQTKEIEICNDKVIVIDLNYIN